MSTPQPSIFEAPGTSVGVGISQQPSGGERKDEALLIQKELMGVCQTGAAISSSMASVILVLPVLAQRQDDNLN